MFNKVSAYFLRTGKILSLGKGSQVSPYRLCSVVSRVTKLDSVRVTGSHLWTVSSVPRKPCHWCQSLCPFPVCCCVELCCGCWAWLSMSEVTIQAVSWATSSTTGYAKSQTQAKITRYSRWWLFLELPQTLAIRLKRTFVLMCVYSVWPESVCGCVCVCGCMRECVCACRINHCCRFCWVSSKDRPAKHWGNMCLSKSGRYTEWGLRPARDTEGWDWLIQRLWNKHITTSAARCHRTSAHNDSMNNLVDHMLTQYVTGRSVEQGNKNSVTISKEIWVWPQ